MAIYNLAERRCVGGATSVSPTASVPSRASSVRIDLTSSQWDTVTGTLRWGIQRSDDGGANWYDWIYVPGEGGDPFPIGFRGKGGIMPYIAFGGTDVIGALGAELRLFAQPSATIRLGAVITVL